MGAGRSGEQRTVCSCEAEAHSESDEETQACDPSTEEEPCEIDGIKYTLVPQALFQAPIATSRSGGTAAFFDARYCGPPGPSKERWGRSKSYWLAKDLARAVDELGFYEDLSKLGPEYRLLHRWAMEYGGVLHARCALDPSKPSVLEPEPRKLMLLRNLRDGVKKLRMLDVKIGSKTAVAGWQGKSASAASRQAVVDLVTNSSAQGFRLEGFDNPPEALDTLLQGESEGCVGWLKVRPGKKAKRFTLQRLCAPEFLLYWIDFSGLNASQQEALLSPIEYSEAVLFDAIGQLAEMCVDAELVPAAAPQMWIGSSVAFACEGGELPERQRAQSVLQARTATPGMGGTQSTSGARAPSLANVAVFDWGRSELNTVEHHQSLPEAEREMRLRFWAIWRRGPLRLLYDAMWLYCTQFKPIERSSGLEVKFVVYDEDTYDSSDEIGVAVLPLEPTEDRVTLTLDMEGIFAKSKAGESEIEVQIERGTPPPGSRLAEIWHITVHSVSDLPAMDCFSDTDPRVEVTIDGAAQAFTPVIYNNNNAEFGSRLTFGMARPDVFESMFAMVSRTVGSPVDASMLPKPGEWEEGQDRFEGFLRGVPKFSHLAPEAAQANSTGRRASQMLIQTLAPLRTVGVHGAHGH